MLKNATLALHLHVGELLLAKRMPDRVNTIARFDENHVEMAKEVSRDGDRRD
jgi:hypothetical protein